MASVGDAIGLTWPATPIRKVASRPIPSVRSPGSIATMSSMRSIDDKPYDRFLIEQIAGDELIDHEQACVDHATRWSKT